jgi:serine/threonine-protein kinase
VVEIPKLLSGRYRLIEPIGNGGAPMVWRAYDELLRRRVAVKFLAAQLRDEERLRAGVQAAALLNHPNVSAVYDYGVAGEGPFVVMELVDGASLAARLTQGPLPWRGAVEVCAYVAAALSAAHARRLVHRDIRPGTIMLTEAGVKVLDFGIAAAAAPRASGERSGPAADVHALGVVLFTALTGRPPAGGRAGLLRGDPGPVPLPLIPGMPLEVAALYQHCVAAEPVMRPAAAALARQFAELARVRVGAVDVRESPVNDAASALTEPLTLTGTRELSAAPPQRGRQGRPGRRGRRAVMTAAIAGTAVVAAFIGVMAAAAAFGPARPSDSSAARWSAGPEPSAGASTPAGEPGPASAGLDGPPAQSCSVAYQVKDSWDNGATVSLSITNTGTADVRQWILGFELEGGRQAGAGWNGTWQQQDTQVTVTGLAGHPDLAAGASVNDVGANIDGPDAGRIPAGFALNGVPCQVAPQP